jgi:hypothetical protein
MPTAKEVHQGTTLTRGIVNPTESGSRIRVVVEGLSDARTQLNTAITTAIAGRLKHPDDATLPLRRATAQWIKGADNGNNAAAWVLLDYDKFSGGTADDTTFDTVADVDLRYVTLRWWADTWPLPGTAGTPVAITQQPDPNARNSEIPVPVPHYREVPVMDIRIPVTLAASAIDDIEGNVGTVNDANFTISDRTFPAGELRNDGLSQRVIVIDDGTSVTYEFRTEYRFAWMKNGWYESILVDDAGVYKADKRLMYSSSTFATPPTS